MRSKISKSHKIERRGRKPKANACWESMHQAAGATGLDVGTLRAAKNAGCPAFRPGGRVEPAALRSWMAEHGKSLKVDDKQALGIEKVREEVRKLRLANDSKEGRLVLRSEVAASMQRIIGPAAQRAEQLLVNEYPTAVAGLDVPAARVYGKRVVDLLFDSMRKFADEWKA